MSATRNLQSVSVKWTQHLSHVCAKPERQLYFTFVQASSWPMSFILS